MYAQVVNNIVDLIGREEVGLPLSQQALHMYTNMQCVDISSIIPQPKIGDHYVNNEFLTQEQYIDKYPSQQVELETLDFTDTQLLMQALTDLELQNISAQQERELLAQQMTDIELLLLERGM